MTTYDTPPVNEPTPSEHVPPVPPHDDSDEPDFIPRPRKRARPLSYVLAGLALMALGTVTGIVIQKHEGRATTSTTSATARSVGAARGTGGTSNGGTGSVAGGGGGGGGGTVGTVTLVDGNNVYVTDATGNVVKVVTNAASQLTKTDPATIKDVRPGETVIVRGATATDGSVTATSLTASPAGSTGGFGRSSAGASTPTGG